jgi:hypothetical protein
VMNWLRRLNPANDPPAEPSHLPDAHRLAAEQLRIGAELQRLRREEAAREDRRRWERREHG